MLGVSVSSSTKNVSGAFDGAYRKWLKDGADKGFAHSQEEVPVDRGAAGLQGSGFVPEFRGNEIVWGYTAAHAEPMEFGTRPFWPPTQPLVEWGERVAGDPSVGFYAQWKIAQEGITAQPYLNPGAEEQQRWYRENDFDDYMERRL